MDALQPLPKGGFCVFKTPKQVYGDLRSLFSELGILTYGPGTLGIIQKASRASHFVGSPALLP